MYGTFVTGNSFQVLRVSAAMGRALTPADDEPSAGQAVMVLSHRGWDRLFARNPAVLGRRVLVNGLTFEIVGVMPEGFRGLAVIASDDYWAPLSMLGQVSPMHKGREATGRPRHHRTPEAGPVARGGSGATRGLGCSPVQRQQSDRARRLAHHAGSEARYRPGASRSGARHRPLVFCVRPHPADWLRQRRQPSPRQGRGATA